MAKRQALLSNFFKGSANDTNDNNDCNLFGRKRTKNQYIATDKLERSRFGCCPLCQVSFPSYFLDVHAASCSGKPEYEKKVRKGTSLSNHQFSMTSRSNCSYSEPLPGLFIFDEFISLEEESIILSIIDDTCAENSPFWTESTFNGRHLGKRWGVHCNLRMRKVTAATHQMPQFFETIIFPKLLQYQQMKGIQPNEANAIDYRKAMGHYLSSHVDNRQLSKESIANLSLAGSCYMTFTPTSHKFGTQAIKVLLKPRTLQILTSQARYSYSHGIEYSDLISERRVSITMRESPLTDRVL